MGERRLLCSPVETAVKFGF